MKPSLSVILPVRNREATIAASLGRLVEVLPDLTPRWEIVVMDDGSTDATPEVATEFARAYPQIVVEHSTAPRGDAACFHSAARVAPGEMLLFRDEDCDLEVGGIHRMWKRSATHELVVARSAAGGRSDVRRGIGRVRSAGSSGRPVLQLIHRRAIEGWISARDCQNLQDYLARKGYPQHEVELRLCDVLHARTAEASTLRPAAAGAAWRPQHCDQGETIARPKPPNYLTRLRSFALGE